MREVARMQMLASCNNTQALSLRPLCDPARVDVPRHEDPQARATAAHARGRHLTWPGSIIFAAMTARHGLLYRPAADGLSDVRRRGDSIPRDYYTSLTARKLHHYDSAAKSS